MATVTGVFETIEETNDVLAELNRFGLGKEDISIAAPEDLEANTINGEYTLVSYSVIDGNNRSGILLTVIAEGGQIDQVKSIFQDSGADVIDTRYSIFERGQADQFHDMTERDRDRRASKE